MICPNCGAANEVGRTICQACGTGLIEAGPTASADRSAASRYSFRDPKILTRWLQGLLMAMIAVAIIAGISRLGEISLLQGMRDGAFASEAEMMAAAEASDARQNFIAIGSFVLLIVTAIVFLMWVYRSCANVHTFGAQNLRITPGWSVGWFFVPIASLWMPYKGMSQIMRASRNPANWEAEPTGPLVGWWWFFYLFTYITNTIVARLAKDAETIEDMLTASMLTTGSYVFDVINAGVALALVRTIYKYQTAASDRSLSAVFA